MTEDYGELLVDCGSPKWVRIAKRAWMGIMTFGGCSVLFIAPFAMLEDLAAGIFILIFGILCIVITIISIYVYTSDVFVFERGLLIEIPGGQRFVPWHEVTFAREIVHRRFQSFVLVKIFFARLTPWHRLTNLRMRPMIMFTFRNKADRIKALQIIASHVPDYQIQFRGHKRFLP